MLWHTSENEEKGKIQLSERLRVQSGGEMRARWDWGSIRVLEGAFEGMSGAFKVLRKLKWVRKGELKQK